MASDKKFDVKVVISAVDNATAQFKEINKKIANSPLTKLNQSFKKLSVSSGLPQIAKAFGNVKNAAGDVMSEVGSLATKLGAIGGLAGAGLFGLANKFATFGDEVKDSADRLGVSRKAIQIWGGAAKLAGVDSDTFNTSVDRFSKNIGEAGAGAGETAKVFSAMGIALKGPDGKLRSMEALLPETIAKLNSMKNAQARAAFGAKLFGKQFGQLVPLVKDWNEKTGIAAQSVFTDEEIGRGDDFIDKLNELKLVFGKVAMFAGSALLPAFTEAFGTLQTLLTDNKESIKEFFKAIGSALPGIIASIVSLLKTFVGFFTTVDSATGKMTVSWGRVKLVFAAIAALTLAPLIASVVSLVGTLWTLGTVIASSAAAAAIWAAIVAKVVAIGTFLSSLLSGLAFLFKALWATALGPIGLVLAGIALLVGLGVALYKNWEPFRNLIDYIWGKIKDLGSMIANSKIGVAISGAFGKGPTAAGALAPNAMAPAADASGLISTVNNNTSSKQEAAVTVNFENAPKGTRVTSSSPESLDLAVNRGWAMVPN